MLAALQTERKPLPRRCSGAKCRTSGKGGPCRTFVYGVSSGSFPSLPLLSAFPLAGRSLPSGSLAAALLRRRAADGAAAVPGVRRLRRLLRVAAVVVAGQVVDGRFTGIAVRRIAVAHRRTGPWIVVVARLGRKFGAFLLLNRQLHFIGWRLDAFAG